MWILTYTICACMNRNKEIDTNRLGLGFVLGLVRVRVRGLGLPKRSCARNDVVACIRSCPMYFFKIESHRVKIRG
jgi:hypothetical protein